jgi:hypothetical protein
MEAIRFGHAFMPCSELLMLFYLTWPLYGQAEKRKLKWLLELLLRVFVFAFDLANTI